ncbi:MAG: hypothetical protein MUP82_04340 [Candidatus Marinimicrobia bacterium]|nr:hypothetical protein [Candidatus Neomarinimicrobiota bacterium]
MFQKFNRVLILLLLVTIIFVMGCEDHEQKEIEIDVVSTNTERRCEPGETDITKFAIIEYSAKNMSTKTINGWKVFFNVHLEYGPQLTAYESIYCVLEPNAVSKTRAVECMIPDYYENAYQATVRHVETW